jgi:hypothetical protein
VADDRAPRIRPRNLSARVVGNPPTSTADDAVANCYPGLELDVRNLDRRFFPGLVVDFVARDDNESPYSQPEIYGGLVRYVDFSDPDLTDDPADPTAHRALDEVRKALVAALAANGDSLGAGGWYLDWVEQAGRRIGFRGHEGSGITYLDGLFVWRIVRGLDPVDRVSAGRPSAREGNLVTVGLVHRPSGETLTLRGWRRRFTDPVTGVISLAYQPGELLQSLCSPWQHDFRDCGCHYWAANHPDVVFGEVRAGEQELPDGSPVQSERAQTLIDWLRADRDPRRAAAAREYVDFNRPYQLDFFQINHAWQDLAFVVDGTEIGDEFVPDHAPPSPRPFGSPGELAAVLRDQLAPLELTLALEYLYARFSVLEPDEAAALLPGTTLADDVTFVRHFLLLTAVSEMQHLRNANLLLRLLHEHGLVPGPFEPVTRPSPTVPGPGGGRRRERSLRPLTLHVIEDFIAIERPDATIDATYERVAATLAQPEYPRDLSQIGERILKDGNDHYSRFRDLHRVLRQSYGENEPWLRPLRAGTPDECATSLDLVRRIVAGLDDAYRDEATSRYTPARKHLTGARLAMDELEREGQALARCGIGICFWDAW